jgi:hypothetical protein
MKGQKKWPAHHQGQQAKAYFYRRMQRKIDVDSKPGIAHEPPFRQRRLLLNRACPFDLWMSAEAFGYFNGG